MAPRNTALLNAPVDFPHDTRKSDVWSLGITFFEILVGRTPFEHSDNEQFSTKDDLEKNWARTLRGRWVGTWKMTSVPTRTRSRPKLFGRSYSIRDVHLGGGKCTANGKGNAIVS
ncbi:hypothetical protein C8F01DRAFT_108778 [Mycena amicta]|nr:hypothetical protein C8F01DRAFT_108778 [Mycena amicta]